jgi:hypothetical protein
MIKVYYIFKKCFPPHEQMNGQHHPKKNRDCSKLVPRYCDGRPANENAVGLPAEIPGAGMAAFFNRSWSGLTE